MLTLLDRHLKEETCIRRMHQNHAPSYLGVILRRPENVMSVSDPSIEAFTIVLQCQVGRRIVAPGVAFHVRPCGLYDALGHACLGPTPPSYRYRCSLCLDVMQLAVVQTVLAFF